MHTFDTPKNNFCLGNNFSGKPVIQPKLAVNQPDDMYEQEANAMANKVMNMSSSFSFGEQQGEKIQRKCAQCEEDEKIQRKAGTTHPSLSAGEGRGETMNVSTEKYINQLSGGKILHASDQHFFGSTIGYDFSKVRIHDDTMAGQSADNINALAYTHGNNIVFGNDQYKPQTQEGKKLLAHELTHVAQQTPLIQPYRKTPKQDKTKDKRYSFNFGRGDIIPSAPDVSALSLIEDSFNYSTDKDTKPWIEEVNVNLNAKANDKNNGDIEYWTGNANVKYYDNPVKWADFSMPISAGSKELGKTSKGNFTVQRIEGIGYNSGKYSGTVDKSNREGPSNRYSKDLSANMSYAVFYNGGEALHAGPLDWSSHGCVHVDWDNMPLVQQLNYHSVIKHTKVKVTY